jgi:uncharacterized protein
MGNEPFPFYRYAVLLALAEKSEKPLGRTALMKLLYFLQELKGVPLGYHFTLYSYGPFDADVLGDLSMTEQLGAVKEDTVLFANGYGYEIRSGQTPDYIRKKGEDFVQEHEEALQTVVREFGHYTGAQLELLSTLVFVDQEADRAGKVLAPRELILRTLTIKPKYTEPQAQKLTEDLWARGALKATPRN